MKTLKDYISGLDKREYKAVWFDGDCIQSKSFGLDFVVPEDPAWYICSLIESVDQIRVLAVGETMAWQAHRGDPNTRGFIVRLV